MEYITKVFTHHAKTAPKVTSRKVSSKNVNYKMFDTDGGFGYFYFTNNESGYNYETTVELANARNVKISYPGDSNKLSLTIPPKKSKIVIYEATSFPYSTSMKIASSFSKAKSNNDMMQSTMTLGKKTILDTNITQSTSKHQDGISIVYDNRSPDIYQLALQFRLQNCHIQGVIGSFMNIMINPYGSKNILIRKDAGKLSFSAKILKADGTRIPCFEY